MILKTANSHRQIYQNPLKTASLEKFLLVKLRIKLNKN